MIRQILQDLMTYKCVAMSNDWSGCYKKGHCDGHCPEFILAAMDIEDWEQYLTKTEEQNYGDH